MSYGNIGDILIVDDNAQNLRVLKDIMSGKGYVVRPAISGEVALKAVKVLEPDLILLDIQMPEMNGYEVCKILKENPKTKDIPVIFISALDAVQDKVKAFDVGGVDYIAKPFQPSEVLARVDVHLSLKRLRQQVEDKNETLEEEIEERKQIEMVLTESKIELENALNDLGKTVHELKKTQKQLVQSEKQAALGRLVTGIAHEINTPLGIGITGVSFLLKKNRELAELFETEVITEEDLENFLENSKKVGDLVLKNLNRGAELVESFKEITGDSLLQNEQNFKARELFELSISLFRVSFEKQNIQVSLNCDEELELVGKPSLFEQIFSILLKNSIQHAFQTANSGQIDIAVTKQEETLLLTYSDNGSGILSEVQEKIFDPFFTTTREKGNTGLGLHILFNLVSQKLSGTVHCTSKEGEGTTFRIELPFGTLSSTLEHANQI